MNFTQHPSRSVSDAEVDEHLRRQGKLATETNRDVARAQIARGARADVRPPCLPGTCRHPETCAADKRCFRQARANAAHGVAAAPVPLTADDAMALAMTCSGELHDGDLTMSKVQLYAFARRLLAADGVRAVDGGQHDA